MKQFETLVFDESCATWTKNQTYNKLTVASTEQYARDKCSAFGWVSLNEVYAALGVARVLEAQIVGWTDPKEIIFEIFINPSIPDQIVVHFFGLKKLL